jgi:glycosyltransferase involved in cell wall biosynthesis
MKILHIFPNFGVGGSQVRFAMLAEALGRRIAHTVLAIDDDYTAKALVPADADVSYVAFRPASSFYARLKSYRSYLRACRPDILITYNWGAIEWALAGAIEKVPHIHIEDGFGPDEARGQLRRRIWARHVALRGSTLVVPSLTLHDIAIRKWKLPCERVKYIPNGIASRNRYHTALEKRGIELPANLPRIVWVGALRPEKNPLRMLRAFAPLRGKAVLLMMGDGPERNAVLWEAQRLGLLPYFRLLGHQDDPRDIVMQCDILGLSSDTEQMPFAVLEAMDGGLAIAATDVGDVRQMVAAENRPFIVPAQDDALSMAMDSLILDRALRARIGLANRARLRKVYDILSMTIEYSRLFAITATPRNSKRAAHA